MKKLYLSILLASLCLACSSKSSTPLNFIIILTDDQRWDTLWAMPILQDKLMSRGITFTNAFASTSSCCPSRAVLLTGQYPHHNGVLTNSIGRQALDETQTVAANLQRAGYKTGMVGKYLHGFIPGFVPPGWTYFAAINTAGLTDWFHLQNITVGSSGPDVPTTGTTTYNIDQYITYNNQYHALDFLDKYGQTPFFLYVAPYAPHGPYTPAPEDIGKFDGYQYRERSYHEDDMSDKPQWMIDSPRIEKVSIDISAPRRLECLQAVDRMVGAIVDKVEALGVADRTVIIFTSDQGLTYYDHWILDKGTAYEEVVRVPLVMYWPGYEPRTEDKMVGLIDLTPTIYATTGITGKKVDGLSLLQILNQNYTGWRSEMFFESYGYLGWAHQTDGIWWAVRDERWKYIIWNNGEIELYDLDNDPYELTNQAYNSTYSAQLSIMKKRLAPYKPYFSYLPILFNSFPVSSTTDGD